MSKKTHKQVYKTLTKTQGKKAISLAKKGVSQQKIAKQLGIAKQSVSTHLRSKGVGKRASSTFWEDVKAIQSLDEVSWKVAKHKVYYKPKWAKKRATRKGKEYKTFQEFWEDQKRQYESRQEKEQSLAEEMEEFEFAS